MKAYRAINRAIVARFPDAQYFGESNEEHEVQIIS